MEFLPLIIVTAGLVTAFGIMSYFQYKSFVTLAVFKVVPSTKDARDLLRAIDPPEAPPVIKREEEKMPENLSIETLSKIREMQ
jgi:hypothetical protein